MTQYAAFGSTPLDSQQPAAAPAGTERSLGEEFAGGLKSNALGIRGGANRTAATVMNAAGLDGSGRAAAADEDARAAEAAAPSVRSIRDVHNVDSALRYGAGVVGGAVPMLAGAAAGRVIPGVGATLGAAAPMLPQELGGQIDRAQADPANAMKTPAEILQAAVPTALASTAVQSIVPGGGLGAAGIRGVAKSVGSGIVAQGLAGAAAEGIRQTGDQVLDPSKGYDPQAIKEQGIENAAVGGVFGLAHAAGGAAKSLPGAAIDKAKAAMPEKAAAPVETAKPAEAPAEPATAGADPIGAMGNLFDSGKAKAKSYLDRMASGGETADLAQHADNPAGAADAIAKDDTSRLDAVKGYADALGKSVMSPERAEEFKAAAGDLSDKANQLSVAGMEKARQLGGMMKDKLDAFKSAVDARTSEAGTQTSDVKKSADYSGVRQAIVEKIAPMLTEHAPDIMSDPKHMNDFADTLRTYMEQEAKGKSLDLDTLLHLTDITNGHAADVMAAVHDSMGSGDPAKRGEFFAKLNQISEIEKGHQSLLETMHKNLKPELQGTVAPSDMREVASHLTQWAQEKAPEAIAQRGDAGPSADEMKFRDSRIQAEMTKHFGDKTDVVMAAVEKTMKKQGSIIDAAKEEHLAEKASGGQTQLSERTEEGATSKVKSYNKDGLLYLAPEHDKKGQASKYGSAAEQAHARATRDNPGTDVSYRTAAELGPDDPAVKATHAHLMDVGDAMGLNEEDARAHADEQIKKHVGVVAETSAQETNLNSAELKSVMLDTNKHPNAPARIDTHGRGEDGNHAIDGVKLTEFMDKRLASREDYTYADDKSGLSRKARMFMEGIAAVQDKVGKSFEIPPETRIDRKGTTWGDVQAKIKSGEISFADHSTMNGEHATAHELGAKLQKLRDAYKGAKAGDKERLQKQGEAMRAKYESAVEAEHVARFLEEHGQQQADPKGPINRLGDRVQPLTTGEDGGSLHKSTAKLKTEAKAEPKAAKPDAAIDNAFVKEDYSKVDLSTKAKTDAFLDAGRERLKDLKGRDDDLSPHELKLYGVLEHLFGRGSKADLKSFYPEFGAHSEKETPNPKAVAASKAALEKSARSGDPKLLEHIQKSQDAKSLQRASEHLVEMAKGLKDDSPVVKALDAANDRMDQLVRSSPEVPYNMQTKKYSFVSNVLHSALGRDGFAAAHDSPYRHDGQFNWREHADKGEGAGGQAFGAGTYLSSGDGTHKYYKALASRKAGETSPTYHLSVDIKPGELLDWNKKGAEQHPDVIAKLEEAGIYSPEKTGEQMYRELAKEYGAQGNAAASEFLQKQGILGHEYSAADGRDKRAQNYVVYDDSKITNNAVYFDKTQATGGGLTAAERADVAAHIQKTLGASVKLAFENLTHAGEFERVFGKNGNVEDIIRLSVHALNPTTVAYHESLHAFMQKLSDAKQGRIMDVINRAASTASVISQLHNLLKGEPEALKQLSDPEERAAYMYQFWAAGKLRVGGETHGAFAKIAQFIRSVLGTWSNDQRAEHIMDYFHSGEYAKGMSDPSAVWNATMVDGRSKALETTKAMVEPFKQIGQGLATAGGANLRDSGIPALRDLANLMKLSTTAEGRDSGYVPTARAERARVMNDLGAKLKPFAKEHLDEALEALQNGTKAASPEARLAQRVVRDQLDGLFKYMTDAGVKVNDLGVGKDYFPRQWNSSYIAGHQRQFLAMVDKYVQAGKYVGDPKELMQKLMVSDGGEFNVEVDKPGMQALKPRVLAFMSHEDVAPFMKKDLYGVMNSYVTQATRRGEWARRFGDDGSGVQKLLKQAEQQGATPRQLEYAGKFVRAVDGTLGDGINPEARRLIGNMLVYQNIRLLPLAIFSSAVDPLGVMVRGGTVSDAFKTLKRGVREIGHNFGKGKDPDDMTRIAQTMGTIDDAMLVHTLGASYSQGMVGDVGRKINDTFFRYNLMEQFNSSMRVGATEAAMNFLVRHADGKATQHSTRYLAELGLQPGDVKVGPDGRPKLTQADGLSLEEAGKMKAAVNRWVDGAVLRPDAVDKPVWMSDPHFALVAHLKQFVFSFHETILKRVAHEAQNGNYNPVMALASYVPVMIAADMIKGMIMGGGSQPSWKQDWDTGDYVMSGIERGGLLGTGQFAADMLTDAAKGGSGVGALLGPTANQILDGVKVMGGRERFGQLAIKSMPANALYSSALKASTPDPMFAD